MPFVLDGERGRIEIEAQAIATDRVRGRPYPAGAGIAMQTERGPQIERTGPNHGPLARIYQAQIDDGEDWRFLQIADDYAWLNPHLTFTVDWFGERHVEATATDPAWAKWRPSDPTSPHWYTADAP